MVAIFVKETEVINFHSDCSNNVFSVGYWYISAEKELRGDIIDIIYFSCICGVDDGSQDLRREVTCNLSPIACSSQ